MGSKAMRTIFGLIVTTIAASALAAAGSTRISGSHANADVAAIEQIVLSGTMGWKEYDVERATSEYAEDAYFFNAFGRERHGKAAIRELIAGVLESPGYRAGKKTPVEIRSIRFLRPDIAVVHTYWETLGQLNQDGMAVGPRRSHTFRTMVKRHGRWQTDSFVVSDERDGGAPPSEHPLAKP
jgi:uncharacterized protein (TIGR02246 family)